jgi:hypothetical protein
MKTTNDNQGAGQMKNNYQHINVKSIDTGFVSQIPLIISAKFCDDCGCEFPAHDFDIPYEIKEMLDDITTCSDCCCRHLEEVIDAESKTKRFLSAVRRCIWYAGYKIRHYK